MLRTSFTLAEKFFSLVINLSHLRRVLRGSVLGPWRLREDEHNERFRPFEPQIRRQGTAVESETAVAARRLIKGSRWSVKCVRGGGGGRREGEREKWGGLSLAVTWNSCFSAARWRWILTHFLPVPPLYLCCQFTVFFGGPESHSFPGERRKINATAAINHPCRRIVAHKRSQSCKCLLLPSAFVFFFFSCRGDLGTSGSSSFAKLLLQGDIVAARSLFRHCRFDIEPKVWSRWAPLAEANVRFHHKTPSRPPRPRPMFAAVTQIMYEEQGGR